MKVLDGDRVFTAHQGDFVYVPSGIRQAFLNDGFHAARMIFMFHPAPPDNCGG